MMLIVKTIAAHVAKCKAPNLHPVRDDLRRKFHLDLPRRSGTAIMDGELGGFFRSALAIYSVLTVFR
jgi:hypothetical protein